MVSLGPTHCYAPFLTRHSFSCYVAAPSGNHLPKHPTPEGCLSSSSQKSSSDSDWGHRKRGFGGGHLHELRGPAAILSYRAILVAIVSQNSLVLCFMGYRTIIARYVAKWGIAQMCLCKTKYQGGVSHHLGGVPTSLKKYRAIWGIAAIVSQYRAIWGH